MAARTILVTGANGEIGAELCLQAARPTDTIYLGGRKIDQLNALADDLAKIHPSTTFLPWVIDLSSLNDIERAAAAISAPQVDLLFANAGIMATDRWETADGFEGQIGVCHLGHFALTARLWKQLTAATNPAVVVTTSSAAWFGTINFDDLMLKRSYSRYKSYGQAKLANALFAFQLNHLAENSGQNLRANAAHPGFVYGNLQEQAIQHAGKFEAFLYRTLVKHVVAQPVEKGVEPLLLAAESEQGGKLFGPRWFTRGKGVEVKAPRRASDERSAARLWEVSEELTGLSIPH